ncbi:ATP-binding protein [Sulfurimonas sp. SAG-AH-194-C21]|nr:ATP-binding protein [Sulfurimonas sp. SAG-AH-194-C21]MDF1882478.1 ATP-binding protein [Sulfurimonas sp. SAG-AH-194-C21]
MEILLEEYYKTDLNLERFHFRKLFLDDKSYQISGISQSGKTKLVKNYLLGLKKNSYLYIDCNDIRIDVDLLNKELNSFCNRNKIDVLVLDNYIETINFVNVSQLIITTELVIKVDVLIPLQLYPLDYEEFLAYEDKYDSSALNHFFQLGGFAFMHKVSVDERNLSVQRLLQYTLDDVEFDILCLCAKFMSQKLSAFTIYERLKSSRKISKDKLYKSYEGLVNKNYIHLLQKFNAPKATKKVYLCDTSLKSALSTEKNFGRLFENMIFLELLKSNTECYFDDEIDFYLPSSDTIILCKPFVDERRLFKKLESIEAFIFTHSIKKIIAISMNKESTISHPLSSVEIVPFDIWALGD